MSTRVLLAALFLLGALVGECRADFMVGLQAYYAFDGNGLDSSGNGNNLTLVGNPTFAPGIFGQALVLDGTGNQYAIGPSAFNFGSNDFTVQVWVNYAESPALREQTLIEQFEGATGPGWTLTTPNYDDGFQFYGLSDTLNTYNDAPTGVWLDVIAERSGNVLSIYVDGSLAASTTINANVPINPTSNPLLIGRRDLDSFQQFGLEGEIDDVAIWNRALTSGEIATLWNNGAGTPVQPAATPAPKSVILCAVGVGLLAVYRLSTLCQRAYRNSSLIDR